MITPRFWDLNGLFPYHNGVIIAIGKFDAEHGQFTCMTRHNIDYGPDKQVWHIRYSANNRVILRIGEKESAKAEFLEYLREYCPDDFLFVTCWHPEIFDGKYHRSNDAISMGD